MAVRPARAVDRTVLSSRDFVDLRDDVFVIHDPGDSVTRFDRSGRWVFASRGGLSYRLGLDGRIRVQARVRRAGTAKRGLTWLSPSEAAHFSSDLIRGANVARERLRAGEKGVLHPAPLEAIDEFIEKINCWTPDAFARHAERFREIYQSVPVLPPDQYLSVYLQAVRGCAYNQCGFCTLYRDRSFRIRREDDWRAHLESVRELLGDGLSIRRKVFFGDANALLLDDSRLERYVDILREVFPAVGGALDGIYSFQDTFTNIHRGVESYRALAGLGFKRIYIGVESGSNRVREIMAKPGSVEDVVKIVESIKGGGISVGLMIMTGVGGRELSGEHVRESLRLIDCCGLDKSDVIFLSPVVATDDADYVSATEERGLSVMSLSEREHEAASLREGIAAGIKVATYDIEGFVY